MTHIYIIFYIKPHRYLSLLEKKHWKERCVFPTHLPLYIPEALCRCCHWWGADAVKFGKYIGKFINWRDVVQNRIDLSLENEVLDQSLVEGRCWKIWEGYWKSCVILEKLCNVIREMFFQNRLDLSW